MYRSRLTLRISEAELLSFEKCYGDPSEDDHVIEVGGQMRAAGEMSLNQLRVLAKWKFQNDRYKNLELINDNADTLVRGWSRVFLEQKSPMLCLVRKDKPRGVGAALASVILHLAHNDRYPVWDQRSLWSCGLDFHPPFDTELWEEYVELCRGLSDRLDAPMRTIDRSLFGLSKFKGHAVR